MLGDEGDGERLSGVLAGDAMMHRRSYTQQTRVYAKQLNREVPLYL